MLAAADLWRISAREVWRRHRRYGGVALGLMLGTLGFVVILTMGREVRAHIHRDLDLLGGATMIKVRLVPDDGSVERESVSPPTLRELRNLPGVQAVSAAAISWAPVRLQWEDQAQTAVALGVDEFFWGANSFSPMAGSFFGETEVGNREKVCVLGAALARRLFGDRSPVGEWVRIGRDLYRIRGTLEGAGVGDRNEFVFLPLTTARDRIVGLSPVSRLYVRCATLPAVETVADAIPSAIRRHQARIPLQVDVARVQLRYVRRLLGWMETFIFLAVGTTLGLGSLGIWTGMLSAVRARTREIGLKKAMGAEDGDIHAQFLAEALCLSLGAAVAGIAGARISLIGLSRVLHSVVSEWLFLGCMLLSLLLSLILGLAAGYWPARQASRMDAVSAMRDE
ncbi:MAG: ABC transporter permease [Kiritimatiellia bacterium]